MQQLKLKGNFVVNVESDAQIVLWNYVQNLIAYTQITPIYYQDAIGGSEFLTYNAGKLYLANEIKFSLSGAPTSATRARIIFYNEANAASFVMENDVIYWDVTLVVATFFGNNVETKNIYFGRLNNVDYDFMVFNGYRITV